MSQRIERIRKGVIPPEAKPCDVLKDKKYEKEIMQANKMRVINCWGFGPELFLSLTEEDFRNFSQIV